MANSSVFSVSALYGVGYYYGSGNFGLSLVGGIKDLGSSVY